MKRCLFVTGLLAIALTPRPAPGIISAFGAFGVRAGAPMCTAVDTPGRADCTPAAAVAEVSDDSDWCIADGLGGSESLFPAESAPVPPSARSVSLLMLVEPLYTAEPPAACTGATLQSPGRADEEPVANHAQDTASPGGIMALRGGLADAIVRWSALAFLLVTLGIPLACASAAPRIASHVVSPARSPPRSLRAPGRRRRIAVA